MRPKKSTLTYALILIAVLMLTALLGWYFFLSQKAQTISGADASRGLGSDDTLPKSAMGNTYSNIISGITSPVNGTGTAETEGKTPPRLWKITQTPVAGMAFVGAGTSTKLYFAESSTGYILTADPETGAIARLTNKLFPKTKEAVFGHNGSVVLRSIDEDGNIVSFAGKISNTTAETADGGGALTGKYLERNISAIVPAPYTRELLYLIKDSFGGAAGALSSWDGTKRKNVFSSPLSNWKPIALADGRVFFLLRPADNIPGFAYELKNGSLAAQVGDVSGLTFLPNAFSTAILYGTSENGSLVLFARTRDDATTFPLPIKTVADKCVWSTEAPIALQSTATLKTGSKKPAPIVRPLVAYCAVPQFVISNTFLNDWYKGTIHTSDSWWRVDVSADTVELVSGSAGDSIDVEKPVMDEEGKYISFINAADKTLWLLRINSAAEKTKTTP